MVGKRLFTYKESGVDVKRGDEFSHFISDVAYLPDWIIKEPTGYATIIGYTDPPIVVTADGVGTKLILHQKYRRWKDAAYDLVAMNYNDIVAVGGKPFAFVDYIGTPLISNELYDFAVVLKEVLNEVGVYLVAGETAEMPGIYDRHWDVVGFCVGKLIRRLPLDSVCGGDVIIGLPSSGFHSNGWSLIRHILEKEKIDVTSFDFDLLKGTRLYVDVLKVLDYVKAIAHVTGGGINRALRRILMDKGAELNIKITNKCFKWILNYVELKEALSTFNMGVGMMLVVAKDDVKRVIDILGEGFVMGYVIDRREIKLEVELQ